MLRLASLLIAASLLSPDQAQAPPPELQVTWDWLTSVLPAKTADVAGPRRLDQQDAEYAVKGCELTVWVGTWSRSTPSDTSMWANASDWVYLVRFEPRSGYSFTDRPMSQDEAQTFQQHHSDAKAEFKYGYVDVIDMSEASLSSFTVIGQEKVPYLPFAGVRGRGKYAYFRFDDESHAYSVRKALLNAAKLCGASEATP